jgi:intracellular septation protein
MAVQTPELAAVDKATAKQQSIKLLIELAPLVVFFAVWLMRDLRTATGVLMVATVLALLAAWRLLGHVTPVLIGTTAIVLATGSMTFLFNDDSFIKMKPTVANLIFAGVLGFGIMTGRPLLKYVLGDALRLTPEGWRRLTIRWICFFLAMAALNEVIWRTMSEGTWINFKVFGIIPMTILFTIAQIGLIQRYTAEDGAGPAP